MNRAMHYEWISLRSLRSTWAIVAAAVLIQLLNAFRGGSAEGLSGVEPFANSFAMSALFGALLMSAIGVNAFSAEYRHRTITTTALVQQSRPKIVLAKAAVLSALGAAVGLLLNGVTVAGVLIAGGAPFEDPARTFTIGGGVVLYMALSALVGLAVAGLLKNAGAALAAVTVWQVLLDGLIASALEISPAVMPFSGMARLLRASVEPQWYMPLPLIALTVVLLSACAVALTRRDT